MSHILTVSGLCWGTTAYSWALEAILASSALALILSFKTLYFCCISTFKSKVPYSAPARCPVSQQRSFPPPRSRWPSCPELRQQGQVLLLAMGADLSPWITERVQERLFLPSPPASAYILATYSQNVSAARRQLPLLLWDTRGAGPQQDQDSRILWNRGSLQSSLLELFQLVWYN